MTRKKKVKSSNSINRNKIYQVSSDPKFRYKCIVCLERCDLSKFSIGPSQKRDLSKQSIDNKKTILIKSKTLNDVSIDHEKHNNKILSEPNVLQQEKNSAKMVQPNHKLMNIQNKCIVRLEQCDFSKFSIGSSEERDLSKQSTDNKKSVYIEKSKTLNEVCIDNESEKSNKGALDLVGKKFLRVRKKVNYLERKSSGTPDMSRNVQNERIPIYRKEQINLPKSRKRKFDLYDFVPESDEDKDSDISFKIDLPIKKRKVQRVRFHNQIADKKLNYMKMSGKAQVFKYNDKIDVLMNKFVKKLKGKQESIKPVQTNTVTREQTGREGPIENANGRLSGLFNSTMLPGPQKIIFLDDTIITKGLAYHISEINSIDEKEINESKRVCIPSSETSSLDVRQDSHSDTSSCKSLENVSVRSFGENNFDNLFGFADNMGENREEEAIDRLDIIQDVAVNGSPLSNNYISTPKRFRENQSWRFDTNVVHRNPHFIDVKKNSLPALSQEPVLDHTFDDRIDVVNKTVLVPTNTKSTRQLSILNYMESAKEYSENHIHSQSLYDIAELSPLEDQGADKENLLGKKISSNKNPIPKRNILGLINDAVLKDKCSLQNNEGLVARESDSSSPDKDKNFGFDTISEVIEDEQIGEGRPKPFRIEFTYKKSKKPNNLPEKITQPVRDSEVRRLVEEDPGFEEVVDKDGLDCGELGLFEDIEQISNPTKNYKFPVKKIKNQDTGKNKSSQVKLSKEAQKWIKQFNEMCAEVEHEKLEIE